MRTSPTPIPAVSRLRASGLQYGTIWSFSDPAQSRNPSEDSRGAMRRRLELRIDIQIPSRLQVAKARAKVERLGAHERGLSVTEHRAAVARLPEIARDVRAVPLRRGVGTVATARL